MVPASKHGTWSGRRHHDGKDAYSRMMASELYRPTVELGATSVVFTVIRLGLPKGFPQMVKKSPMEYTRACADVSGSMWITPSALCVCKTSMHVRLMPMPPGIVTPFPPAVIVSCACQ